MTFETRIDQSRDHTWAPLQWIAVLLLSALWTMDASGQTTPGASLADSTACRYSPFVSRTINYADQVSAEDPFLGTSNAAVTVIEYFDPNCPHCKAFKPVMDELVERYGDHARFYMIPFVLWPYSLGQIEALYVAAAKGKYYQMLDAQYDAQKQGGLSVEEIGALGAKIGIDSNWLVSRIEEGRHQKEIIDRREKIAALGVHGTPTIAINGRYITDGPSKTVGCIGSLIEAELAGSH